MSAKRTEALRNKLADLVSEEGRRHQLNYIELLSALWGAVMPTLYLVAQGDRTAAQGIVNELVAMMWRDMRQTKFAVEQMLGRKPS